MGEPMLLYTSRKGKISDIYPRLVEAHNLKVENYKQVQYVSKFVRLWKLNAEKSLKDLSKHLKDEIIGLRLGHSDPSVSFPGELLEPDTIIENAEIAFDDIVVMEMKAANVNWSFHDDKAGPSAFCENCRKEIAGQSLKCTCK